MMTPLRMETLAEPEGVCQEDARVQWKLRGHKGLMEGLLMLELENVGGDVRC